MSDKKLERKIEKLRKAGATEDEIKSMLAASSKKRKTSPPKQQQPATAVADGKSQKSEIEKFCEGAQEFHRRLEFAERRRPIGTLHGKGRGPIGFL